MGPTATAPSPSHTPHTKVLGSILLPGDGDAGETKCCTGRGPFWACRYDGNHHNLEVMPWAAVCFDALDERFAAAGLLPHRLGPASLEAQAKSLEAQQAQAASLEAQHASDETAKVP